MGFAEQFSTFTIETKAKTEGACRAIALGMLKQLIQGTPVDTGHLRNNWQCNEDRPAQGVVEGVGDESSVFSREVGKIKSWKPVNGKSLWIVNNVVYGPVLEYGLYPNPPKHGSKTVNGYSKQAPRGWVRLAVAEYEGKANGFTKEAIA